MDSSDRIAPQGPTVRLIVNADDFGRTPEINAAIATAHDAGIVTSASLMVAAPAAREAVALARERPGLAVGLHLVTLGGAAILSPGAIPHLVDAEGRFPRQAFAAGVRYAFSAATRAELAREMRAQFEAFRATGLQLSHVDGHHHMHLHPGVFAMLLPLAHEYGARGIRVSVADQLVFSLRGDTAHPWLKLGWKIAFVFLAANARRLLRHRPVPAADRVYGLMQTGHVTEGYLLRLFERLAKDTRRRSVGTPVVELFCHPSLRRESKGFGPNPADLAAVVSPVVRRHAHEHRVELTSYPAAFPPVDGEGFGSAVCDHAVGPAVAAAGAAASGAPRASLDKISAPIEAAPRAAEPRIGQPGVAPEPGAD